MRGTAHLSEDGRYRWTLHRGPWGLGGVAAWIGCNPSTADATKNDPTIRKEIGFSSRLGYGALVKVNLAPHRATKPRDLRVMLREDGQDGRGWRAANHAAILSAAASASVVIAAWGAIVAGTELEDDAQDVLRLLRGTPVFCLGTTAAGFPRHPLMVAYATPLEEYRP